MFLTNLISFLCHNWPCTTIKVQKVRIIYKVVHFRILNCYMWIVNINKQKKRSQYGILRHPAFDISYIWFAIINWSKLLPVTKIRCKTIYLKFLWHRSILAFSVVYGDLLYERPFENLQRFQKHSYLYQSHVSFYLWDESEHEW